MIEDTKKSQNSLINFFKMLTFFFSILSIICHYLSAMTNPGLINHKNNISYIEFYSTTRTIAVKRAEAFNKSINDSARNLLKPPVEDSDDEYVSDAEYDTNVYEKSKIFTEDKIKEINEQYGYKFNLCIKCNVCRMPGSHHCSICKAYIDNF